MATLFRVVNQGLIARSLLLDKIDRSTGSFETGLTYAQGAKQKVYVPLHNPLDTSVKGYTDLVPTNEVLLSMNGKGTIAELQLLGYVSVTAFNSSLTATPVITGVTAHATNPMIITGTTLSSLSPDNTYVKITNASGVVQTINTASSSFTGAGGTISPTSISVPFSVITGTPGATWTVAVFANSKLSNSVALG